MTRTKTMPAVLEFTSHADVTLAERDAWRSHFGNWTPEEVWANAHYNHGLQTIEEACCPPSVKVEDKAQVVPLLLGYFRKHVTNF